MKALLFTDPHLGLKRTSHTTSKSQKLLRDALFDTAFEIVSEPEADIVICVGDLFDQSTNDEEIISQGLKIASLCNVVLAGNHDVINRTDKKTSLALIDEILWASKDQSPVVISPDPVNPYFKAEIIQSKNGGPDAYFICVPHCFTQDVFAATITEVSKEIELNKHKNCYVFLHCNVGDGYGSKVEDGGSSLWLTDELYGLIKGAKRIFVGHEHEPSTKHKNLHVLGNTYPVSFGEIADRFKYILDTETDSFEAIPVVTAHNLYKEIDCHTLIDCEGELTVSQPLIEVTGFLKTVEYPGYARALMRFWKTNPELQAVKNNVTTEKPLSPLASQNTASKRTLLEIIEAAAEDSGFSEELKALKFQTERN